jgi:hypothetical protein
VLVEFPKVEILIGTNIVSNCNKASKNRKQKKRNDEVNKIDTGTSPRNQIYLSEVFLNNSIKRELHYYYKLN